MNILWLVLLFLINLTILSALGLFTYESFKEKEPRAPYFGIAGVIFHLILGILLLSVPQTQLPIAIFLGIALLILSLFLIPNKSISEPKSAADFIVNEGKNYKRFDERDTTFSRNQLQPHQKQYKEYYQKKHDLKKADDQRRARGGPFGKACKIDGYWWPNIAMLYSPHEFNKTVGDKAIVDHNKVASQDEKMHPRAKATKVNMTPSQATHIVKNWAQHLGAGIVGVCKADTRWIYTHKGRIFHNNWEDWGKEFSEPLPYAVVFATEMDHMLLKSAPHSPAAIESALGYARGAFIANILSNYFIALGYKAIADHSRSRNHMAKLVPLAIDAGLGELGRFGFLITDKFGSRNRLAAVFTDMPLQTDTPTNLGVEKFCEACVKCSISCPSQSIPIDKEQTIENGLKRWKINADKCFDYWSRIGTDCGICMAVCPFGRPNRTIHKFVRFMLKRSQLARIIFPHIDNLLYGRHWKPRKPLNWLQWPIRHRQ